MKYRNTLYLKRNVLAHFVCNWSQGVDSCCDTLIPFLQPDTNFSWEMIPNPDSSSVWLTADAWPVWVLFLSHLPSDLDLRMVGRQSLAKKETKTLQTDWKPLFTFQIRTVGNEGEWGVLACWLVVWKLRGCIRTIRTAFAVCMAVALFTPPNTGLGRVCLTNLISCLCDVYLAIAHLKPERLPVGDKPKNQSRKQLNNTLPNCGGFPWITAVCRSAVNYTGHRFNITSRRTNMFHQWYD